MGADCLAAQFGADESAKIGKRLSDNALRTRLSTRALRPRQHARTDLHGAHPVILRARDLVLVHRRLDAGASHVGVAKVGVDHYLVTRYGDVDSRPTLTKSPFTGIVNAR
jgi:hypothetical protein